MSSDSPRADRQLGAPRSRPTVNPLSIRGTAMQPNLLLMAKLVALAFIISGQLGLLSRHFVPFIDFFRHVGSPSTFHYTLEAIFLIAAAALLLNQYVRVASITLGLVVIVGIVSSMFYYENNREYCALILVLAGLEDPRGASWLLRWQIVLLYLAAALNKVLLADWRDGHFFDAWMGYLHHSAWVKVSEVIPGRALGALLSWAAIVTEFGLATAFAVRRHIPVVIWIGIAYHTTLVLVMNRTFGMFWVAAPASYLAFVNWPTRQLEVRAGTLEDVWSRIVHAVLRIDVDRSFRLEPGGRGGLELVRGEVVHRGWSAMLWLVLLTPLTYFVVVVIAMVPQPEPRVAAFIVLLILAAVAASAVQTRWRSGGLAARAVAGLSRS